MTSKSRQAFHQLRDDAALQTSRPLLSMDMTLFERERQGTAGYLVVWQVLGTSRAQNEGLETLKEGQDGGEGWDIQLPLCCLLFMCMMACVNVFYSFKPGLLCGAALLVNRKASCWGSDGTTKRVFSRMRQIDLRLEEIVEPWRQRCQPAVHFRGRAAANHRNKPEERFINISCHLETDPIVVTISLILSIFTEVSSTAAFINSPKKKLLAL
ncbi:hypothetical protein PoB_007080900 [Plakobranchus ocellatus]|uniref:Uncharacterized protein n=1 Tax=Plakobranchus ocellatus TaxID=259542 RepID=A0AAV4DJE0_9GAST|nr:hypothetical protein PoB_007080900 [Plakobranchus ocellatus]